jgi:hypothetical protein
MQMKPLHEALRILRGFKRSDILECVLLFLIAENKKKPPLLNATAL